MNNKNHLTVLSTTIKRPEGASRGRSYTTLRCDCGNEFEVLTAYLKQYQPKHCPKCPKFGYVSKEKKSLSVYMTEEMRLWYQPARLEKAIAQYRAAGQPQVNAPSEGFGDKQRRVTITATDYDWLQQQPNRSQVIREVIQYALHHSASGPGN